MAKPDSLWVNRAKPRVTVLHPIDSSIVKPAMAGLESTRRAIDAQIEQLDTEILQCRSRLASLEAEKVGLKRRRNALAPIARLPAELLSKVFSSYRTPLSHSELNAFCYYERGDFVAEADLQGPRAREAAYQKLLCPDTLALCHVSQAWRDVAFGFQGLWTHIQIQLRSSPDLFKMMWRNAGKLPIQLDIAASLPDRLDYDCEADDFPAFALVVGLLKLSLGRFKSIGIYTHPHQLLNAMPGRGEHLESLVVVDLGEYDRLPQERVLYSEVLVGGCPNLRHLELVAVPIPWSSPLLSSPHLTHLALDYTPRPTPESIADLISTVRRLPLLKYMKLRDYTHTEDEEMDFILPRTADRSPIELTKLEVLDVHWGHRGPLTAFLSLLRIPEDIQSLSIDSGDLDFNLAEAILNFSALGRSGDNPILPEAIEIMFGEASCWKEQCFKWQTKGEGPMSYKVLAQDSTQPAWLRIQVSTPPDPNPTAFRLPWSFDNLRSISMFIAPTPDTFWELLATLHTLEIIQVTARDCQPFFAALSNTPNDSILDTEPRAGPDVQPIPHEYSMEPPTPNITFPGLRAIWFAEVRDIGPAGTPSPFSPSAAIPFAEEVLDALKKRGSDDPLEEMRFLHCGQLALPSRAFKILSPATRCIVWEGRVYVRNETGGRAERFS